MTSFEDLPENEKRRILRDEKTLRVMGEIYCSAHHEKGKGVNSLCPECEKCIEYAIERTRECPHQHKGNCDQCAIRCYRPDMRARIRAIMSYAGPRMAFLHPVMTIKYLNKKRSSK